MKCQRYQHKDAGRHVLISIIIFNSLNSFCFFSVEFSYGFENSTLNFSTRNCLSPSSIFLNPIESFSFACVG